MKTYYESSYKKLERRRGVFFRIGMLITLLITFIAFEWETAIPRQEFIVPDKFVDEVEILVPITWQRADMEPVTIDKHKSSTINNSQFVVVPDETINTDKETDSILVIDIVPVNYKPEVDTITDDFWLLPEIAPEFPGKEKALVDFLKNNIRYPERERVEGIIGTVYMNFIIDEFGNVSNIECLRSPGEAFTSEAARVLKKMPKWKPGMQGGKAVNVKMSIPVNFKLL